MRRRPLILLAFLTLLAAAFLATAKDDAPGTIKKITEGVWFREGEAKEHGYCNNAIIEMKDYLIVVDANFPGGARAVMADAKKVSSKPVKYVFDTHHHGDHAYGNFLWTEAGATTLAYKGVVEEMNRYEPQRWLATAKTRPDVRDLNQPNVQYPKQTFDGDSFTIKDETREVRFLHFGWAHTRGDAMLWLPKERVLCTGDAVVNGGYNNLSDANIGNWPTVIGGAMKLKPAFVLPGHGASGGAEILTGQRKYLVDLHQAIGKAIAAGTKMDQVTSIDVPEADRNWIPSNPKNQIRDTYEEIAQKKPHGDTAH